MSKGKRLRTERQANRPEIPPGTRKRVNEMIRDESRKVILEMDRQYKADFDAAVLYYLAREYDYTPEQLRQFWDGFNAVHHDLERHIRTEYGMGQGECNWYCKRYLMERGVDVDAWEGENDNA